MAAANFLPSEDQFLCSICLDVFTDPVTTSCGHNFCKTCLIKNWSINYRCRCPMCKEVFTTKPDLKVNTLLSEMVSQFRQSAQQKASSSSSEQQVSKPGGQHGGQEVVWLGHHLVMPRPARFSPGSTHFT